MGDTDFNIDVTAVVSSFLTICGCLYIVLSTLHYAFLAGMRKKYSILRVFPFFIALCDLLFGLDAFAYHVHHLRTGEPVQGFACGLLGAVTLFVTQANALWISATAYFVWSIVVGRSVRFGPYAWRLHLVCWGIPTVCMVIMACLDGYGFNGQFCLLKPIGSLQWNAVIYITQISFAIGAVLFCCLFYGLTFSALLRNVRFLSSNARSISRGAGSTGVENNIKGTRYADRMRSFAWRLSWLVVIYWLQWMPAIVYNGWSLAHPDSSPPEGVSLWLVFNLNIGGLLNAIVYNLCLTHKKKGDYSTSQTNEQGVRPSGAASGTFGGTDWNASDSDARRVSRSVDPRYQRLSVGGKLSVDSGRGSFFSNGSNNGGVSNPLAGGSWDGVAQYRHGGAQSTLLAERLNPHTRSMTNLQTTTSQCPPSRLGPGTGGIHGGRGNLHSTTRTGSILKPATAAVAHPGSPAAAAAAIPGAKDNSNANGGGVDGRGGIGGTNEVGARVVHLGVPLDGLASNSKDLVLEDQVRPAAELRLAEKMHKIIEGKGERERVDVVIGPAGTDVHVADARSGDSGNMSELV